MDDTEKNLESTEKEEVKEIDAATAEKLSAGGTVAKPIKYLTITMNELFISSVSSGGEGK